jgi:hypothetical protein
VSVYHGLQGLSIAARQIGELFLRIPLARVRSMKSGSATWNWEEIEQYNRSYTAGECMRTDTQTRTKTLSGMSSDTKDLVGTVTVGDTPPHVYSVMWSFQR